MLRGTAAVRAGVSGRRALRARPAVAVAAQRQLAPHSGLAGAPGKSGGNNAASPQKTKGSRARSAMPAVAEETDFTPAQGTPT